MEHGVLPEGVERVRVTDEFAAGSVPAGLLRAHRVAAGTWGRLRVRAGSVRFVWEGRSDPEAVVDLAAGDSLVIPPDVPHRVELGPGGTFVVEFHR